MKGKPYTLNKTLNREDKAGEGKDEKEGEEGFREGR